MNERPGLLHARLRPGLAPNGSRWLLLRERAQWQAGQASGLAYDSAASALQLAPRVVAELVQHWLPLAPVRARDGRSYRLDPAQHRLLVRGPCDTAFAPVPGIGGRGHATGRLCHPAGLAVDEHSRPWLADTGNARIQVIDPAPRSGAVVAAVLAEGLREPVHVALDGGGNCYVADRGTGRIHVFGADLAPRAALPLRSLDPWSGEPWAADPPPRPLGVAVTAHGTLAVFDPGRPFLWHMACDGTPLPALPWPADGEQAPGWPSLPGRYAAEGELLLGPLDGGVHNFAWHELEFDATLPPGTRVLAQTCAHNEPVAPVLAWAPRRPVALVAAAPGGGAQTTTRLVLSSDDAWQLWRAGRLARALAPVLAELAGDGPVGGALLRLPGACARQLRRGDRIALVTPAGGQQAFRIVDATAANVQAAVSGAVAAFAAPQRVQLIERRDEALPDGPLDLAFLGAPTELLPAAAGVRDARPEPLRLAHELAAFLREGDVIEIVSATGRARVELVEHDEAAVTFRLDAAVAGDFSHARVELLDGAARAIVGAALPALGALPSGSQATLLDDAHGEQQPVSYVAGDTPLPGLSTVWLGAGAFAGEVTPASWNQLQFPAARATDRGRYLWLRLRLQGALPATREQVGPATLATATPAIHALRITGPRPSLLPWLPALYARRDAAQDPPGASFLERFLTLFEGRLNDIERAYESIGRLLNPAAADAEWLTFVAGWIGLSFDPSWPAERRRRLVIEGAALQAGRGTPAALARYLEIYTGAPVGITEDFMRRPGAPIQLGARGALGLAPLGGEQQRMQALGAALAHRFKVSLTLPREVDAAAATSAVRRIVETMKPAHTAWRLRSAVADVPRIGIDTVVGATVIAPDLPCCDDTGAATAAADPLQVGGRLGRAALRASNDSQGVRHA